MSVDYDQRATVYWKESSETEWDSSLTFVELRKAIIYAAEELNRPKVLTVNIRAEDIDLETFDEIDAHYHLLKGTQG